MDKFRTIPNHNRSKQAENLKEMEKMALSFDKGVAESIARIEKLFNTFDRSVFVMINGSSTDVGKSFLLATLQKELRSLGIPTQHMDLGKDNPKTKTVIFTLNTSFKDAEDINFGVNKFCDLYIGIYRPDKKFYPADFVKLNTTNLSHGNVDIMICNENAKDDPHKSRYKPA